MFFFGWVLLKAYSVSFLYPASQSAGFSVWFYSIMVIPLCSVYHICFFLHMDTLYEISFTTSIDYTKTGSGILLQMPCLFTFLSANPSSHRFRYSVPGVPAKWNRRRALQSPWPPVPSPLPPRHMPPAHGQRLHENIAHQIPVNA